MIIFLDKDVHFLRLTFEEIHCLFLKELYRKCKLFLMNGGEEYV